MLSTVFNSVLWFPKKKINRKKFRASDFNRIIDLRFFLFFHVLNVYVRMCVKSCGKMRFTFVKYFKFINNLFWWYAPALCARSAQIFQFMLRTGFKTVCMCFLFSSESVHTAHLFSSILWNLKYKKYERTQLSLFFWEFILGYFSASFLPPNFKFT